ncbi:MAG TPA: ABC transporter ATP-binding protein [Usitatibacter sp.]|nr:ABC transporter ATP-binding protein [Usitatibacter sp.]
MAEALRLEGVRAGYGASIVVDGVSLSVAPGECVAILGRNGVGKSTLLGTIMGLVRLHAGEIQLGDAAVAAWPAHRRARAGLGWVPQERRMWRSLTVDEHLATVARPGTWTPARVRTLFPRLAERSRHRGSELSGGEQQMLAIGRALVTNPRVLLLDEPMEGLAPIVVQDLAGVIRSLVQDGSMAVLLVEQHARLALSIARRAVVMERGRVVHEGASAELAGDEAMLARLLAVR